KIAHLSEKGSIQAASNCLVNNLYVDNRRHTGNSGVFGSQECRAVAYEWRKSQTSLRAALIKVSFLPDHTHLAIRAHPSVSPADLVVELMNSAQQVIFERFARAVLQARLERLWQLSDNIGSYGDLTSPQIRKYIHNFAGETDALAGSVKLHETSSCISNSATRHSSYQRETPRDKLAASRIQR
ncbi:MAG: transposase, partial [Acidobacteriales bacterium]|nr:transposase [Terriglobales bacterium]